MITATQIEAYGNDGVLFPIQVLSAVELAHYRARAEEALAIDPEIDTSPHSNPHLKFDWAGSLATHPAVVEAASAILGETAIWGSMLLLKKPHSRTFVSWHQDGAYRGYAPGDVLSAWIALADSVPANGCMQVIRGSHNRRLPHRDQPEPDNMISLGKHIEGEIDPSRVTDVVLRAGEMSIHHNDIIHGSGANDSDSARLGFVVRFMRLGLPWSGCPLVIPGNGSS